MKLCTLPRNYPLPSLCVLTLLFLMIMGRPTMGGSLSYDGKNYILAGLHILQDIEPSNPIIEKIETMPELGKNRYGTPITLPLDSKGTPVIHTYMLETKRAVLTGEDISYKDQTYNDRLLQLEKTDHFVIKDITAIPTNEFVIVEAPIYAITEKKDRVFINFAPDWRTDLSLIIQRDLWDDYFKTQLSQQDRILVRGYSESYYGPMIKIMYKNQIKKLD